MNNCQVKINNQMKRQQETQERTDKTTKNIHREKPKSKNEYQEETKGSTIDKGPTLKDGTGKERNRQHRKSEMVTKKSRSKTSRDMISGDYQNKTGNY